MRQLGDDLYLLRGFPPNIFNVYLAGGVLIDTGSRHDRRRILRQLENRDLTAVALTHAHGDHLGSAKAVCEARGVPYWVPERDVEAAESGDVVKDMPDHFMPRLSARVLSGPGHPVDRALREGDEVAGFTVFDVPGHAPGHVAYWRESDRALILGDVAYGLHPMLGVPGYHEPPDFFTPDPARNRESARRLADLEPALICFGHGAPRRDTDRFRAFVASLPTD